MNHLPKIIRTIKILFIVSMPILTFKGYFITSNNWLLAATLAIAGTAAFCHIKSKKRKNLREFIINTLFAATIVGNIVFALHSQHPPKTALWEIQMKNLMKSTENKKFRFVGYDTIKEPIAGKEIAIQRIFATDAHIGCNDTILMIKKFYNDSIFEDFLTHCKNRIEKTINADCFIIKTKWEFNNKIFNSTAIIDSTSGRIIFDNIGTFATNVKFDYSSTNYNNYILFQ